MKQLAIHLAGLRRAGLIEDWQDRMITAGEDWRQAIENNLETAGQDCSVPVRML
jgi:hypothetical protein